MRACRSSSSPAPPVSLCRNRRRIGSTAHPLPHLPASLPSASGSSRRLQIPPHPCPLPHARISLRLPRTSLPYRIRASLSPPAPSSSAPPPPPRPSILHHQGRRFAMLSIAPTQDALISPLPSRRRRFTSHPSPPRHDRAPPPLLPCPPPESLASASPVCACGRKIIRLRGGTPRRWLAMG